MTESEVVGGTLGWWLHVDQRVRFYGEKRARWTVQAVCPHGRFAALTYPFAPQHTVMYTMVDLVAGERGVDNSIGNSLGYETREDCEEAVAGFCSGDWEFSHRRRPIPLHFEEIR